MPVQICIDDPETQAYIQHYPFLHGPDEKKNQEGRMRVAASLRLLRCQDTAVPVILGPLQCQLSKAETTRAQAYLSLYPVPPGEITTTVDDFGWKVNCIPRNATNLLVAGCGDGREIALIRAILPDASITAISYEDLLPDLVKRQLRITMIPGDVNRLLDDFPAGTFDTVFSNHFLEHLYNPVQTLRSLRRVLNQTGVLVSGLPFDGELDAPFSEELKVVCERRARVHPVDYVLLNAGHPWKTDCANARSTAIEAGFTDCILYRREDHPSRYFQGSSEKFDSRKRLGLTLHRNIFHRLHSLTKRVFPSTPPRAVLKLLFAVESRVWFGTNRLTSVFSREHVIVAQLDSYGQLGR